MGHPLNPLKWDTHSSKKPGGACFHNCLEWVSHEVSLEWVSHEVRVGVP